VVAGALDVGAIGAGLATAVAGTIGLFEWELLFLLAPDARVRARDRVPSSRLNRTSPAGNVGDKEER
jgi:hypothetical protein